MPQAVLSPGRRVNPKVTPLATNPIITAQEVIITSTPSIEVAPNPPLNLMNIDQLCPATAAMPAIILTAVEPVRILAVKTASVDMLMSDNTTMAKGIRPAF